MLKDFKPELEALANEAGLRNLRVFGSVSKNTADTASDIDILYTPSEKLTYIDVLSFKDQATKLLGFEVNPLSERAIENDPNFLDVLKKAISI